MEQEQFETRNIPTYLNRILDKTESICQFPFDLEAVEGHAIALDKTISLLTTLQDSFLQDANERNELELLTRAFVYILNSWKQYKAVGTITPTTVASWTANRKEKVSSPGRPPYDISSETLEELRALGFSWSKIASLLGVSRWTLLRRVEKFGLHVTRGFSDVADEELDKLVKRYISCHGATSGQQFISGYIKSLGLRVQRRKIRESMIRVDPCNTTITWGAHVSRGTYKVPWPNSLWHLDGHFVN